MSVYFLSVLKTDFTFKKLLYKHIFTHFTQMLKPAGQNVFLSCRLYTYYVYFLNNISPMLPSEVRLLSLRNRRRFPLRAPDPVSL